MIQTQQTQHLSAGCCPWCGAAKTIQRGNVILTHPPEACCLPRAVWNLSWLAECANDPDYAEDIRQIKARVRQLLAQEDNPAQALEHARKLALAHQGHGNVYAVVQALAGMATEARR
ncbi:MAG: hypothetical protein KatS3mg051_1530 [Anaerolineae bacterium]|nr:MAG: hypothetical protein KatS3mg051_1530 [Anaerolineae bacterium]